MAEFVMKDLVEKAGLSEQFQIDSAGTCHAGGPVYPPARRKLAEHGIDCTGKTSRQLRKCDYDAYDLLIGMDDGNLHNMCRICGGDPEGKFHLLLDFTSQSGEIADPWYTGNFDAAWRDVAKGCQGLLRQLEQNQGL